MLFFAQSYFIIRLAFITSGGGPIHARVPIHAHPQFSQGFIIFHRKDVYHIIDNSERLHLRCRRLSILSSFTASYVKL